MSGLLTYSEAAEQLSVCSRTVRRMVNRGELPVVALNSRCHRIRDEDVADLIARKLVTRTCHTDRKTAGTGISRTPMQAARELEGLLAQPTGRKPKS